MKSSFSLFEVVISFIILSIVIGSIIKLFSGDDNIKRYYELQDMQNSFIEKKQINDTEEIRFR